MALPGRLAGIGVVLAYDVVQLFSCGLLDRQALLDGDLALADRRLLAAPATAVAVVLVVALAGALGVRVQVVLHEAGHALVGALLGLRVRRISLFDTVVLRRGPQWLPDAGPNSVTATFPPDATALPLRMAAFHLAGPAVNLVVGGWLWTGWAYGPRVGEASMAAVLAGVALRGVAFAGAFLGLVNLVPFRMGTDPLRPRRSDGLGLLTWLSRPGSERERLRIAGRAGDGLAVVGLASDLPGQHRPADEDALRARLRTALHDGTAQEIAGATVSLAAASSKGGVGATRRNAGLLATAAWHPRTPPAGVAAASVALGMIETHLLVAEAGLQPLPTQPDGGARHTRAERIDAVAALWERALAAGVNNVPRTTSWLATVRWLQGRQQEVQTLVRGIVLDGTASPDVLRRLHLLRAATEAAAGEIVAVTRSLRAAVALQPASPPGFGQAAFEDAVRRAVVRALPDADLPYLARLVPLPEKERWVDLAHEASVDVRCAPDAAWALLTDPASSSVVSGAVRGWRDPATPGDGVGDVRHVEMRASDGRTRTHRYLLVEQAVRRHVWVSLDEDFVQTSSYAVEAAAGGTRVTLGCAFRLPAHMAEQVSEGVSEDVRGRADRVRARLEADT